MPYESFTLFNTNQRLVVGHFMKEFWKYYTCQFDVNKEVFWKTKFLCLKVSDSLKTWYFIINIELWYLSLFVLLVMKIFNKDKYEFQRDDVHIYKFAKIYDYINYLVNEGSCSQGEHLIFVHFPCEILSHSFLLALKFLSMKSWFFNILIWKVI